MEAELAVDVGVVSDSRSDAPEVRNGVAVRADNKGDRKRGGEDTDERTVASGSGVIDPGDRERSLEVNEASGGAASRVEEDIGARVERDRSERDAESLPEGVEVEGEGTNVVRAQRSFAKSVCHDIMYPDRYPRDPAAPSAPRRRATLRNDAPVRRVELQDPEPVLAATFVRIR